LTKRRVVVTGLGIVSPLGSSIASAWDGICNGRSGIGTLTIQVSPAGLQPGLYTGSVVITNPGMPLRPESATNALVESVTIPVTMLVLPPKEHKVYVPLVARSSP